MGSIFDDSAPADEDAEMDESGSHQTPSGPASLIQAPDPLEGSQIGNYKLLQRIGEGGFGVVYMAEQVEFVHRKVALKIIKAGMDTKQVIARFEAERQALAMMEHPNIARVLDVGETSEGRPYIVMELVKGMPITSYCHQHKLDIDQRIELFLQVCSAVQHAHVKGVIHRDLKPSNILITLHDDKAVPKVIDFGIAKAMDQRLTDKTLFTRYEHMVGTPAYMSPEQAALSGLDVDTRSDVYALGVLLYELLTGTAPFNPETLRAAAFDEMRRIIREDEPPKPSVRITTLQTGEQSDEHFTPPPHSTIASDLDWIVMKALEKDRDRRYETASGLAQDLERFRHDEPVIACPPRAGYRALKFYRRNKTAVIAGALVCLALLAGAILATIGFIEAKNERNLALEAKQDASQKAAVSEAISSFLRDDLLAQANPYNTPGQQEVTLKEVLDRASSKIDERFADQPHVRESLHRTLAFTYDGIGSSDNAEQHARKAVDIATSLHGRDHAETLASLSLLGQVFEDTDDQKALEIHQQVLEGRKRAPGPEDPATLRTQRRIANLSGLLGEPEAAIEQLRQVLESQERILGNEHSDALSTKSKLVRQLFESEIPSNQDEAISLARDLVAHWEACCGEESTQRIFALHSLATILLLKGQNKEAENLHREVLGHKRRIFGEEHAETVASMGNLGATLLGLGRYDEAFALLEQTLELDTKRSGEAHPTTLTAMNSLARGYMQAKRIDDAIPFIDRMVLLAPKVWGKDHQRVIDTLNFAASSYTWVDRKDEAWQLYQQAFEIVCRKWEKTHPLYLKHANTYAEALGEIGRFDQALELIESVCTTAERELGKDHIETAMHLDKHAGILMFAANSPYGVNREFLKQAVPIYKRVIDIRTAEFGPDHPLVQEPTNSWILCRMGSGEQIRPEEMQRLREAFQKNSSSEK